MRKRFRNIQVPFIFLPILLLIFSFFSYGILAGKLGITGMIGLMFGPDWNSDMKGFYGISASAALLRDKFIIWQF
jgi:hypothetical protein